MNTSRARLMLSRETLRNLQSEELVNLVGGAAGRAAGVAAGAMGHVRRCWGPAEPGWGQSHPVCDTPDVGAMAGFAEGAMFGAPLERYYVEVTSDGC